MSSRRGADHHVIAVLDRQPEKLVADRAADGVNLHREPVTGSGGGYA